MHVSFSTNGTAYVAKENKPTIVSDIVDFLLSSKGAPDDRFSPDDRFTPDCLTVVLFSSSDACEFLSQWNSLCC